MALANVCALHECQQGGCIGARNLEKRDLQPHPFSSTPVRRSPGSGRGLSAAPPSKSNGSRLKNCFRSCANVAPAFWDRGGGPMDSN